MKRFKKVVIPLKYTLGQKIKYGVLIPTSATVEYKLKLHFTLADLDAVEYYFREVAERV